MIDHNPGIAVQNIYEIKKIDSNRDAVQNIITGNGKSSSSIIVDGSAINTQLIEMNQKLLGFKEELQFTNGVQLVQGFNKFSQPTGSSLFFWLAFWLFVFLSIAYVYALFSSISNRIKARKTGAS